MKTLKHIVFGIIIPIAIGVIVFYFLQQKNEKNPDLSIETYSNFEVAAEDNVILILNAGESELLNASIDFKAVLDDGEYNGSRTYQSWKPGEVQSIGIMTSQGPKKARSIEFSGTAKKENKYVNLLFKR